MKKLLVAAVATVALLGMASSSFALLCASDQVPAGTLLFPFVTAKYAPTSTATNPVADRTAPTTLFAVTNISDSARIVHFVLWNDFSFPVIDWDALLTGYDVITYNMADIIEGYLRATGGTTYSPTGTQPIPQGPVPSFFAGIPSLPIPEGVGATKNVTTSLYGLCTAPAYTTPLTIDTQLQANRIPEYNRSYVYNGLRKSQVISENGWWLPFPPFFSTPDWLLNRSTTDNVWGYVTADVVARCSHLDPSFGQTYFTSSARPVTDSYYANNAATNYIVELGNTIIGDAMTIDTGNNYSSGNPAVHIEMDNQDIINSATYPRTIVNGASFYRYSGAECHPSPEADDLFFECIDYFTGTAGGSDFTTGADYFYGSFNGAAAVPTNDFREPLPSAFAFRWLEGAPFDGTKLRVWKEFPDTYVYYGFTLTYATLQYAYYAWDEQERVLTNTTDCPVSPCPQNPGEINMLPLEIQEVSTSIFNFPRSVMSFGWSLFAFLGSNTLWLTIPSGYATPFPNTYGTQAWIDVEYQAAGKFASGFSAAVIGNFLCDGLSVYGFGGIGNGVDVTDLGDVLY